MRITKFGHCCLLVEEGNLRILTDPGMFTTAQNDLTRIDIVLVTHEHQDHVHVESLQAVLQKNPNAKIVTNRGVGKLLGTQGISCELLEDTQSTKVSGVLFEGFGQTHATIYEEIGQVINTGYFIANRFFYPGDALYDPRKPVEILALPVAGPWIKTAESVDYALRIKPKVAFPVHDGVLSYKKPFLYPQETVLPRAGIEFTIIADGESAAF